MGFQQSTMSLYEVADGKYRCDVDTDSVLHRFHGHTSLIFDGEVVDFVTLELLMWHILLIQHGCMRLFVQIMSKDVKRTLYRQPGNCYSWVVQNGFDINADWYYQRRFIFQDILLDHAMRGGGAIYAELARIIHVVTHPSNVEFFVSGTDYVWSSGIRANRSNDYSSEILPGYNVFGDCLWFALNRLFKRDFTPNYGLNNLQVKDIPPTTKFSKTVLIASDSQCRPLKKVYGGEKITIPGGTFRDIFNALTRPDTPRLMDFRYIIIECGANDVQKLPPPGVPNWEQMCIEIWEHLFLPLRQLLLSLPRGRDCPCILVSLCVPHQDLVYGKVFSDWIERSLMNTGVHCQNWYKEPHIYDFVKPDPASGKLVMERRLYTGFRYFHLSHAGFRVMWDKWCQVLPELKYVPYKLVGPPNKGKGRKRKHSAV